MLSVILQFGCIAWLAIGRKGIEFDMCIGNLWRKADNANFNRLGGKESLSKPDSLKKILLLLFLVHVLTKSKSSSILFPENLVSGLISDLRGKTKGGRQTEREGWATPGGRLSSICDTFVADKQPNHLLPIDKLPKTYVANKQPKTFVPINNQNICCRYY